MIDLFRDLATGFAVAFTACAFIWMLTGGRAHRSDRIGSAGLAIGFIASFVTVTGGGWHPADSPNYLPLVAVVVAQLAPRLIAQRWSAVNVPLAPRVVLLVAGIGGAAAFAALGDRTTSGLLFGCDGAALGILAGGALKATPSTSEPSAISRGLEQRDAPPGQDPRLATWVLFALLGLAVVALR